eukprot:TRINITY_DN9686_c0_g1_i1.p1 TRINITY_DN9686_c0_g1~~TRINITY_DN9686_c0_g1_i1.p1  ORF type:complete len:270 (+),score=98.71 TRINITY_DN9686_c0_g1_i1:85-810(+)
MAEPGEDLPISEELVKLVTGQFDLASVLTLPLGGLGIRDLKGLAPLCNLTNLDLSGNRVAKLEGLDGLGRSLLRLDLRDNCVSRLEGLQPLQQLEVLRLQGNRVSDLDSVLSLAGLPRLRALHLQDLGGRNANPVCRLPRYGDSVTRRLKSLSCLDGEYFLNEDLVPRRVGDGEGEDLVIPDPEPWVPKGFFDGVLSSQRPGPANPFAAQEKSLLALLAECRGAVQRADAALAQQRELPVR